jgi:hypothetical protein
METPSSMSEGTKVAVARPWSSTWVKYYDRASRRRHQLGGYRKLRNEAKWKRRAEWIWIAAGAAGVVVLFGLCCVILTR